MKVTAADIRKAREAYLRDRPYLGKQSIGTTKEDQDRPGFEYITGTASWQQDAGLSRERIRVLAPVATLNVGGAWLSNSNFLGTLIGVRDICRTLGLRRRFSITKAGEAFKVTRLK